MAILYEGFKEFRQSLLRKNVKVAARTAQVREKKEHISLTLLDISHLFKLWIENRSELQVDRSVADVFVDREDCSSRVRRIFQLQTQYNVLLSFTFVFSLESDPSTRSSSSLTSNTSMTSQLMDSSHLLQAGLHVLHLFFSYCLMLVFMTYNAYLCIALCLGGGIGYWLFAWKRADVIDPNEHCN